MGGTKKSGKGGGGGGKKGGVRNVHPNDRAPLRRDPGMPSKELREAGARLARGAGFGKSRVGTAVGLGARPATGSDVDGAPQMTHQSQLAALALRAAHAQQEHNAQARLRGLEENENGTTDLSRKQDLSLQKFVKDFKGVVSVSDVLLEVLDVRDPLGSRLHNIEREIESSHGDSKTVVFLLNKTDLVAPEVVEAWKSYFEETETFVRHVVPFTTKKGKSQSCISYLYKILRSIARGGGEARKSITVGCIGYPNVGKSSVINALKRKNVVGVGNTPGFTTGNTEVELRGDVKIIDCPGVVAPGEDVEDVVLRSAVKIDQLQNPLLPLQKLFQRCDKSQLSAIYGLERDFTSVEDFVHLVGIRRGRIGSGGVVNEDETAKMVLQDWNDGRIPFFTLPPVSGRLSSMAIGVGLNGLQSDEAKATLVEGGMAADIMYKALPTFHLLTSQCNVLGAKKRERIQRMIDHSRRKHDDPTDPEEFEEGSEVGSWEDCEESGAEAEESEEGEGVSGEALYNVYASM